MAACSKEVKHKAMLRQCVMNQREVIDCSRLEQQTVYQNVSRRNIKVKVKIFITDSSVSHSGISHFSVVVEDTLEKQS